MSILQVNVNLCDSKSNENNSSGQILYDIMWNAVEPISSKIYFHD